MLRRRRPHAPLARRRPLRIPVACDEVLSGAPAAGRLIGPGGSSETKLCAECYAYLEAGEKKLGWDKETMLRREA